MFVTILKIKWNTAGIILHKISSIYVDIQTDRQTERQTDRQTDR